MNTVLKLCLDFDEWLRAYESKVFSLEKITEIFIFSVEIIRNEAPGLYWLPL